MRCVELALSSAEKGLWDTGWPDGYAMLMSLNKGETAVHGCHCLGDMAVRMLEVLAMDWWMCAPFVYTPPHTLINLPLFIGPSTYKQKKYSRL